MEYGIQISGDLETVVDAVDFAVENSLVAIAVVDHYLMSEEMEKASTLPAYDALSLLAVIAHRTGDLEISTQVSPVTFRHPAVMAKAAVTIDAATGGRFKLGVGTGWHDLEHEVFGIPFPDIQQRFAMLENALGYLRAAFEPDHPGFEGEHYSLRPVPLAPVPSRPIPIKVGGGGPRLTPRLAGTYANEFNIVETNLKQRKTRIARARQAAEQAGRDPDALLISGTRTILGADNHAELTGVLDELARSAGMETGQLRELIKSQDMPIGTWDRVFEVLAAHEAIGISRIYLEYGWEPRYWDRTEAQAVIDRLEG